ncbi:MAG: hypothetical protein ACK5KL_19290 [Dysgonomonas sp.]
MKTISEIKEAHQNKLSKLFESLGIFFAFSKEQFEQSRKEGVVYADGGYGMIIPKDNVQEYLQRVQELAKEVETEYAENIPLDDYIEYELHNHEAFYTWSTDDAFEAVKQYYPNCTSDDMKRVFNKVSKSLNS